MAEDETTAAEKLAITPGSTVWCSDAAHLAMIEPLPEGVRVVRTLTAATTALLFADSGAAARALLDEHGSDLTTPAALWVAYPAGTEGDVHRDTLWPMLTTIGLRPASQVSLSETWEATRFRPLHEREVDTGGPS
jgi:hypothetical protein